MGGLALEDSDIEEEEGGEGAGGERAGTERAARSLMLDDNDTLVEEKEEGFGVPPPTSIFAAFQGSDPDGGPDEPAPPVAERGPAVDGVVEGLRRVYGRKPVDQASAPASPQKAAVKVPSMFGAGAVAGKKAVVEVGKDAGPVWRAPALDEGSSEEEDSEEEGEEGEGNEGDVEGSDGEESESEEESDDEEEAEAGAVMVGPQEPVKKSLNDVLSIKKQATGRMGTLESGYLRTEQEALGYHDDIGVAKEVSTPLSLSLALPLSLTHTTTQSHPFAL